VVEQVEARASEYHARASRHEQRVLSHECHPIQSKRGGGSRCEGCAVKENHAISQPVFSEDHELQPRGLLGMAINVPHDCEENEGVVFL
jgi:hypothetical protein